jgi:hypothetical protein
MLHKNPHFRQNRPEMGHPATLPPFALGFFTRPLRGRSSTHAILDMDAWEMQA